ncbi:response regulator [Pseudomonas benzenivorans]|uniref:Response regulator n=1 Tax=Pseudomonas benzenivorans TaxID=556533 RepID=A0ABY5H499_9PSED|nr:response regulator [Pseudomonas benzenivorans]UTW07125.1 response regulator [Pseudomonas benzenivorans]
MSAQILLVDDEPHVLRLMRLKLEGAGYRVDTAGNGKEGLQKLQQQLPDVLITDIQMPEMNGEQLCQAITEHWPDRRFLIVLLTSRTEVEHRRWSSGIDKLWFIEKPVSMRRLLDRLDDYIQVTPRQV